MGKFHKKLQQLDDQGRLRRLSSPAGIDLSSNDYLGLASHAALRQAAHEFLEQENPIGSRGSRLLRGNAPAHVALENYAAKYFGFEKSLYFANGFLANYSLLTALPDRHDVILYDALVHASMREGIKASGAKAFKFAHNDVEALEDLLKRVRPDCRGEIWIAAESVYSMDGDLAPLAEIAALAQRFDAYLIIDEAHATGVFGTGGRGLADGLDASERLIVMHTCGKALGVSGALVCASSDIIDYLVNASRAFIYSTAPLPLQAHLVQKALELCASEDGNERRRSLQNILQHVKSDKFMGGQYSDLGAFPACSQIIPIMIGDDVRAVAVAAQMQEVGFDIRAIRPPTVPDGTARLRLSLNVNVTPDILKQFEDALMPLLREEAA